jgi:hypothetical protein
MYPKAPWKPVIKQIDISSFSAMVLLEEFDNTWGARMSLVGGIICLLKELETTI